MAQWETTPPDAVMPDWKAVVPEIVSEDSDLVNLYNRTWEIAAGRVRRGPEGMVASPYLDENCYDDQIWIWDGCFMVMFSKYGPEAFPGKETLMNYYAPIHDGAPSPLRIHLRDNPPLFAWVELENYKFTADTAHIRNVLLDLRYLQRHYDYFNSLKRGERNEALSPNPIFLSVYRDSISGDIIGYGWNGNGSGMDNTPRGRGCGGWNGIMWVDAICQQALAANCIAELLELNGQADEARKYRTEYEKLKQTVNERYWDEEDGFYYDVDVTTGLPCRVKTVASFWALMAGIPSQEQAERMVAYLQSADYFGGEYPWNSLSRDDPDYNSETGDYWRGGIWLPMAYMGTKALERYGFNELADSLAAKIVGIQSRVYRDLDPHTVWETYSPEADAPSTEHGHRVRQEFCGWSALGPISLTIENLLGFRRADGLNRVLEWDLKPENGLHGISRLRFGQVTASLVYYPLTNEIMVSTNEPFTLRLNGVDHQILRGVTTIGGK